MITRANSTIDYCGLWPKTGSKYRYVSWLN